MSKLLKMAAVLFIIAVVFGCASSKTSTGTTGKVEMPTGAPSGTIHWEGKEFMAILEGQWGHGTLAYNGKVYKFKTSGFRRTLTTDHCRADWSFIIFRQI